MLTVIATGVLLTGCDRFAARSDIAAEAGELQLSAERVGGIVAKMGQGPTIQAAEFVSNLWLDYALFARAVADGSLKTDSATIAEVRWPTIANTRIRIFSDSLSARRSPPTAGAVDSAYDAPNARILQHLIVIPKGPTPADTTAARNAVLAAAARIKQGTSFGQVASEIGEDNSKGDQGYLGYLDRGRLVKEFEEVGYALQPGQVSDLVTTQFGFHLIRRPTLEEARPRIAQALAQSQAGRGDSAYLEELQREAGVKVAGGAAVAMKAALADPDANRRSTRTLVAMKGGDVTIADFVKWTSLVPLNQRIQVRQAEDSLIAGYAKGLAQQVLLLRQADSADVQVPVPMWQFISLQYTQTVDQVRNTLGLNVAELAENSTLTPEAKVKLAGEKVEDFFGRLVDGRAQMAQVLPELSDYLRAKKLGKVNQAGLARSVELAMAQHRRDSAAAAARPPASVVQPAPGGPPISDTTKSPE
jgi:hypothetical protein